jgi:hypothetical protein
MEAQSSLPIPESERPRVNIEFDPELATKPYFIGVNPDGFYQLLRDLGVSDDFISTVTLRIAAGKPKGNVRGEYRRADRRITIYSDRIWKKWTKAMNNSEELSKGKKAHGNPFKGILHTKRLSSYLQNAPPERSLRFAERMIAQGLTRYTIETALHESQHVADDAQGYHALKYKLGAKIAQGSIAIGTTMFTTNIVPPDNLLNLGISIGYGLWTGKQTSPIAYYFNPLERRARDFAKI